MYVTKLISNAPAAPGACTFCDYHIFMYHSKKLYIHSTNVNAPI